MARAKSKVLITGSGGMLGEAVYNHFRRSYTVKATDIDLNEKWLDYLDVRDLGEVEKAVNSFKPDIILHLAALTDVEYCETNPNEAWKTNALGTENVALLCKKYNIVMVYISTAGVFDGNKEFYTDFDRPNPINAYGESKYYGEIVVQRSLEKYFIFRASWMMGGGPSKDKKLINKVYKQIKAGKKTILGVTDKSGVPTYTYDFAKNMELAINSKYYGLYNMACEGQGSRYDVINEFIKCMKLQDKIQVKKVNSTAFKKDFFAPRPASEIIVDLKLSERDIKIMRDWKTCMKEYAKKYIKDYSQKL